MPAAATLRRSPLHRGLSLPRSPAHGRCKFLPPPCLLHSITHCELGSGRYHYTADRDSVSPLFTGHHRQLDKSLLPRATYRVAPLPCHASPPSTSASPLHRRRLTSPDMLPPNARSSPRLRTSSPTSRTLRCEFNTQHTAHSITHAWLRPISPDGLPRSSLYDIRHVWNSEDIAYLEAPHCLVLHQCQSHAPPPCPTLARGYLVLEDALIG